MSLSSTTARVAYSGNGSTTDFAFPYTFLLEADLKVVLRTTATGAEVLQTLAVDYTVTGEGVDGGGTVSMVTAPTSGQKLTIYRDPSPTQDLNLVENDPMPAEEIEERLDKLTMICQRLLDAYTRTLKKTEGYTAAFSMELPELLTASTLLGVNADGDGFELTSTESLFTGVGQQGSAAISNAASSVAVTFSQAFDDNTYSGVASIQNTTDSDPIFQPVVITSKSASGFTASFNAPVDSANYSLAWIAFKGN